MTDPVNFVCVYSFVHVRPFVLRHSLTYSLIKYYHLIVWTCNIVTMIWKFYWNYTTFNYYDKDRENATPKRPFWQNALIYIYIYIYLVLLFANVCICPYCTSILIWLILKFYLTLTIRLSIVTTRPLQPN